MPEPGTSFRRAVVCVPARNEAEVLPRLLGSLGSQDGVEGLRLRVVVLANNCSDDTAGAARRAAEEAGLDLRLIEASLPPEAAHVGTARRMALDAGAAWLEAEGVADGVLLSTDADALAPPNWVTANLRALEGAELVGGRLVIDDSHAPPDAALAELHRRIECYWAGIRALEAAIDPPSYDPEPRHGDHVAASLALRADLYRAVGGLPVIPCGEDNALVALVRRHGGRVRHCPAVSIRVSARRNGRVEGGMATEMLRRSRVVAGHEDYRLPPAGFWRALIERRRDWRLAWNAVDRQGALRALGIGSADLAAIGAGPGLNDIAFVERMDAHRGPLAPEPDPVPLGAAIAGIDDLLREPASPQAALCA
ncbi:glycosyltransferase [Methylobacterium iners]|uniref:Glycosyltransferase 2-like domain-containing protein n=1 Tax=Methylobacterium iners TaxID=418707 RepID=A0ABQ4S7D2_9HYPH|nr:glycosyltransferase [Methylobacterium iners]GJD97784.1 hypothetical protein OCOJLMKI_5017 [Methylobacterium iners]